MPLKVMSGPMSVYVCSQECLKSLNHASQGNVQTHGLMSVYVCTLDCAKSLSHDSQLDVNSVALFPGLSKISEL
ncbi:hypothetical protein RRG08_031864 [Elysia crispata]|uniref:Uncharacterized protein n=1 Tax=Elysia crispata TaxID=231223 RepID=A0AAE1AI99_9GAST|nr:hypothetical protein RRG08_031864 [Elysia crispata]